MSTGDDSPTRPDLAAGGEVGPWSEPDPWAAPAARAVAPGDGTAGGGTAGGDAAPVPTRWPSAWPHLWHAARDRLVFVAAVAALTVLGIAAAGDLRAEWWVPLVPLLLLVGPASRPGRVRTALQRATARGRLSTLPGRLGAAPADGSARAVLLRTSDGHAVAVPLGEALAAALVARYPGEPALLVWASRGRTRGAAALVLGSAAGGPLVAYLRGVPTGVGHVATRLRPTAGGARLVRR